MMNALNGIIQSMDFLIGTNEANQRADKFLKRMLKDAPLSFIYKMFRQKDVKVNGKKADIDLILKEGDVLSVYLKQDLLDKFHKDALLRPVKADFKIIYEDENILIADKPRGLLAHGEGEEKRITLQNMVLNYLASKREWNPSNINGFIPAPAHRLDRNTSGIMIFGKNLPALQVLQTLFRERDKIKKQYLLLVKGITSKSGEINIPLIKDPDKKLMKAGRVEKGAKEAKTIYEREKSYPIGYSLVKAELLTGRTHQLRAHFSLISHPIVGDAKYGDFETNDFFEKMYSFKNQFLHAYYFEFLDDIPTPLNNLSNKVFTSELPAKEKKILESLKGLS